MIRLTLGCPDIMMEIMSFVPDQEFLTVFINYLMNFPKLNVETILPILTQRKELVCDWNSMAFLEKCLQNIPEVNAGILIEDENRISQHISMIEKFSTVQLRNMEISCEDFLGLISPRATSRIHHMRLTNFRLSYSIDSFPGYRKFSVSPHLKKFTFESDSPLKINPILLLYPKLHIDRSNIEELVFLSKMSVFDKQLVYKLSSKLVKLSVLNNDVPKDLKLKNNPILKYLGVSQFSEHPLTCQELYVHEASSSFSKPDTNVKRITFGKGGMIETLNDSQTSVVRGLGLWLKDLMVVYPNCEELILSETFFDDLVEGDTLQDVISCSMKRIILKHSKQAQPSKYGSLKFMLQVFFPKAIVKLEEISNETCVDNFERFEMLPSSNRILKVDCYEDVMFRRIEKSEQQVENTQIKNQIREMKMIYCSCIISKKLENLALVQNRLNILEGLKQNKKQRLEIIHGAIRNYNDIFTNDGLYMETVHKFDLCLQTLDGECYCESLFSERYSDLEVLFDKMIQVVEEHNYPSKVLFSNQWLNEHIVEMYSDRVDENDIQFIEDSDEEMMEAFLVIDSDPVLKEDCHTDFELVA